MTCATRISLAVAILCGGSHGATALALDVTAGLNPDGTATAGKPITLTATVSPGDPAVAFNQLVFCLDEACASSATAPVGSDGTASITFTPVPGCNSYSITGLRRTVRVLPPPAGSKTPTMTVVDAFGAPGAYDLNAKTTAVSTGPALSGSMTVQEVTSGGLLLASGPVTNARSDLSWNFCQGAATGTQPSSIATGDYDGDGHADVAVSNAFGPSISIFLGNGDGTLTKAALIPLGFVPGQIVTGNFRGLGTRDLAVASTTSAQVAVFFGNADGTFTAGPTLLLPGTPTALATGSFGGNGTDLVAGTGTTSGAVSLLRCNGDGTFQSAITTPLSHAPAAIAVVNFGIVVSHPSADALSVLGRAASGGFVQLSSISVHSPDLIASGDFHGAGNTDVVVVSHDQPLSVLLTGDGSGTFTSGEGVAVPQNPVALLVADIDGDGRSDIVTSNGSIVEVARNVQAFEGGEILSEPGATALAAGDFDQNGTLDLAVVLGAGNNALSLLLSQPIQTVTALFVNIATIGAGIQQLEARYSGDAAYAASSSPVAPVTSVANVFFGPLPPPITLSANGATDTRTVQINPGGGLVTTVQLDCAVIPTTPDMNHFTVVPTCSIDPKAGQIGPNASLTATLTVRTTAAHAGLMNGLSASAMASVLFFMGRRRRKAALFTLFAMAAAGGFACGHQVLGTSPGSYRARVITTFGSQNVVADIPLTVQ